MQVRATATFQGRMGLIERGIVFTCPDGYAAELMRNRLVEPFTPSNFSAAAVPLTQDPRGPDRDRNLGDAPRTREDPPAPQEKEAGNESGGTSAGPATSAPAPTSDDGRGITSSSLRRGRASGKKT